MSQPDYITLKVMRCWRPACHRIEFDQHNVTCKVCPFVDECIEDDREAQQLSDRMHAEAEIRNAEHRKRMSE